MHKIEICNIANFKCFFVEHGEKGTSSFKKIHLFLWTLIPFEYKNADNVNSWNLDIIVFNAQNKNILFNIRLVFVKNCATKSYFLRYHFHLLKDKDHRNTDVPDTLENDFLFFPSYR